MGAGVLSVGAALSFLKSSFAAAVEESRMLDQMRAANESLAGSSIDARAANEQWLQSLESASGKTKEELVPSYIRLVAVTGDVAQAHRIAEIAAGASAKGFGELGQITQALIRYYETGQTQTRGFGAVLKALVGDAKDVGEGFDKLNAKFGDGGRETDNLGLALDRLKVKWKDLKAEVGDFLIVQADAISSGFVELYARIKKVVTGIDDLKGHSRGAADAMYADDQKIGVGLKEVDLTLKDFAEQYDTVALSAKNASKTTIDGIRAELAAYRQMAADPAVQAVMSDAEKTKLNAKIIALEKQLTGELKTELTKRQSDLENFYRDSIKKVEIAATDEKAQTIEIARIYKAQAADKNLSDSQRLEAAKRYGEEIGKLTQLAAKEAEGQVKDEAAKKKAYQDSYDTWLANETKRVEAWRKDRDEEAKIALRNFETIHKLDLNYLAEYQKFTADMLANWSGTKAEEVRIARAAAETETKLKVEAAHQLDSLLAGSLTTLGNYFNAGKELSIAQAIINTYEGATKALAQGGIYGEALAAVVIAAGLADVATIAATGSNTGGSFTGPSGGFRFGGASTTDAGSGGTPGSEGFDNPQNDFAAYVGGQRWASDMVDHYSAGAAAGFSAGMMRGNGSSVAYNTSTRGGDKHFHNNITINGFMGSDDLAARQLARKLSVYLAIDQRRSLR